MKNILLAFLICAGCISVSAQTTIVQAFDFSSQTRDTMINFPNGDHNKYEKILMHYGMRCKDALVSTPAERNKGCGEWDYSCNTYVVDSTRVDSLRQVSPDYVISNFDPADSIFYYTTEPTYTYYQSKKTKVEWLSGTPMDVNISAAIEPIEAPYGTEGSKVSMVMFLGEDHTTTLQAGEITALKMAPRQGSATLENFSIEMQQTGANDVNDLTDDWIEVYNDDYTVDGADNRFYFHTPFDYDGSSQIAVRLRYDSVAGDLQFDGLDTDFPSVEYTALPYESFADFGTTGYLATDEGLDDFENEITISFWHQGSTALPLNSTALEAVDESNVRQLNVHLPWGNSQVYWDCGNDGSGYDRINKTAQLDDFSGHWNHWAFTKNATSGEMHIYLNGELWHSGTGKFKAIDAKDLRIGRSFSGNNSYAQMSEYRMWNKALSATEIKDWMRGRVTTDHPSYENLKFYYSLDKLEQVAEDLTANGNNARVVGQIAAVPWRVKDAVMETRVSEILPAFTLDQGVYQLEVTEIIELDSLQNLPSQVTQYRLDGTDRVEDNTQFLYPTNITAQPILDEEGLVLDFVPVNATGEIKPQNLTHYTKSPMEYELMSFVTPYGIYLDLGEEGESWVFDVTDFGPILKGPKRFFMSKGGQWQEEMDIWFEFIEGEPARDVLDIEQIWPCRQNINHARITDDTRFEPRLLEPDPTVVAYEVKTRITGHGQQGEFEPRTHYTTISTFSDEWSVWTECADNPVYPQGGTWIYDRAGWCPGKASDTRVRDITVFMEGLEPEELFIDYGINFVTGNSNYIVNSQLVTYGGIKREVDVELADIINPSPKIEHRRSNPSCLMPTVRLKNLGKSRATSVIIKYGIVGGEEYRHEFRGQLEFGMTKDVMLDDAAVWVPQEGGTFYAEVESVNGAADEYAPNNMMTSQMGPVDLYERDIIIEYRTNNVPSENEYTLYDQWGNEIFNKKDALIPVRTYRDTIRNLNGCYRLEMRDSDDDGLEFFANGDGTGLFRIRSLGGANTVIEPDFGKFARYGFVAGGLSDTEDLTEEAVLSVYPNPSTGQVFVSGLGEWDTEVDYKVVDQLGRLVVQQSAVDKYILTDGGVQEINDLHKGFYHVIISDSERRGVVNMVRL